MNKMPFVGFTAPLTPHFIPEEDGIEKSLRPQRLQEFIGQSELCQNLRVFIQAARTRQESLDHVLFHGPPGLGKTTLAQILAREMGTNFRATAGPILVRPGDLAAQLTALQAGDVLFIDEIHRLPPAVEEILYPALEDRKLDIMIGEGAGARAIQIDLPAFTLVAATTRTGLMTAPLRDRFGIILSLQFYPPADLEIIIHRLAELLNTSFSPEGAHILAKRCRGTPRIAGRLLRRIRDFAHVHGEEHISVHRVTQALSALGINEHGLDQLDQRLLTCMATLYKGGPVGLDTLAAALAEQKDVVEEVIEPYLLQQGFIQRTPRGRVLTEKGFSAIHFPAP